MNNQKLEKKSKLIEFAITFALVFVVLSLVFPTVEWIKKYSIIIALFFLLAGVLYPVLLSPLSKVWYKFAIYLGVVTNTVLLSVIFYLLIAPLAIVKKLVTKKKKGSGSSYWIHKKRVFTKESLEYPF